MQKFRLKTLLATGIIAAAFVFNARGWPWMRLSDIATTRPIVVSSPFRVVSDTLHSGENIATLLDRQGVTGLNLQSLAIALSFDPKRIKAGLVFSVHKDGLTDEPTHIEFRPNAEERLQFVRTSAGWVGHSVPIRWTVDTVRMSTVITSSLYEAMDRMETETALGLADRMQLAYDLARINQYAVDFQDVQPGDQVAAVYTRLTSDEGQVAFGEMLASIVTVDHKDHTAIRYDLPSGKEAFYDEKGESLVRALLRSPFEIQHQISSHFSSARRHPILGLMRRHEGTDYAADRGTKVIAAGDGVVIQSGYAGGYGNLIEVKHKDGSTTRYGHLSARRVRVGEHVTQGEVIGNVGSTGLATGPHLHYEYRINGVAKNPEKLASIGAGPAIGGDQRSAFKRVVSMMLPMLRPQTIASATITE